MIKINDDYYISVDKYEYELRQDLHKENVFPNGRTSSAYTSIGHYTTLSSAVNGYIQYMRKLKLMNDTYSLKDAVKAIREVDTELKTLLNNIEENQE